MGCGVSKDDIAEPRPVQSHGREKFGQIGKDALKPIQVTSTRESTCISSLYISSSVLSNPSSPPSVFIHTDPDSLSSDDEDEDEDPSFEFPSKLSIIKEFDNNESRTTALAALSGKEAVTGKEDLEERVKTILVADDEVLSAEQSDECLTCPLGMLAANDEVFSAEQSEACLTCPLGMLSGAAILQALMSTSPAITQQYLGDDLAARVGHVTVISGPEPNIRWDAPLRKAEIIDLDEEPDAGVHSLMLENIPEQQENQSDQEQASIDHASLHEDSGSCASLSEEQPKQDSKPDDAVDTNKTLSSAEPRKTKLPPLTIVPPILVEIPANPFGKPAFPIVIKQDLLEVKVPNLCETEQIEDLSARTPTQALESADRPPNGNHHDMRIDSPVTEYEDETPIPATKSPAGNEWRSLHRNLPDPDIEDIVLLESQDQLDSLPLIPTLDCHGIHMDNKDLISPRLRLIS